MPPALFVVLSSSPGSNSSFGGETISILSIISKVKSNITGFVGCCSQTLVTVD